MRNDINAAVINSGELLNKTNDKTTHKLNALVGENCGFVFRLRTSLLQLRFVEGVNE